jgi:hypothetical protein
LIKTAKTVQRAIVELRTRVTTTAIAGDAARLAVIAEGADFEEAAAFAGAAADVNRSMAITQIEKSVPKRAMFRGHEWVRLSVELVAKTMTEQSKATGVVS